MTTQLQRLEESHEKLRGRVRTIEDTIVELRTDMKWVRWFITFGTPIIIGQLLYVMSRLPTQ